jgi:hypothetical protein
MDVESFLYKSRLNSKDYNFSFSLKLLLQLGHAVVQLVEAVLCATSRKVAGSIFHGDNGIFRLHNSFVLESAKDVTEINTRNISWGGG